MDLKEMENLLKRMKADNAADMKSKEQEEAVAQCLRAFCKVEDKTELIICLIDNMMEMHEKMLEEIGIAEVYTKDFRKKAQKGYRWICEYFRLGQNHNQEMERNGEEG